MFFVVQEWREVQTLIGKTGKESLKRRVSEFDVDKLQLSLAMKVKDLLKNYNMNEIRDTSHGVATFYVWVCTFLLLVIYSCQTGHQCVDNSIIVAFLL